MVAKDGHIIFQLEIVLTYKAINELLILTFLKIKFRLY
jgi:hypothetical protein